MTRALALAALLTLIAPSGAEAKNGAPDAFAALQKAARQGRSLTTPTELARERIDRSLLPRGRVSSDARLLFDGKRAHIQLTVETRLPTGVPQRESHLIRVPLGRLLGWYGRALVRSQFPALTPAQVSRALP